MSHSCFQVQSPKVKPSNLTLGNLGLSRSTCGYPVAVMYICASKTVPWAHSGSRTGSTACACAGFPATAAAGAAARSGLVETLANSAESGVDGMTDCAAGLLLLLKGDCPLIMYLTPAWAAWTATIVRTACLIIEDIPPPSRRSSRGAAAAGAGLAAI